MSGEEYIEFLEEFWEIFEDDGERVPMIVTDARL